jgi:zinc transporter
MPPAVERFALGRDVAGVEWRHLYERHPEDVAWLRGQDWLPPVAVDALLAEETRPRYADFGNGDVIILRGINLNPGDEPDDMVALRCWFSDMRVVTVSRRQVQSVKELRERVQAGTPFASAGGLLVALGQALTVKIRGLVRTMEEAVGAHEDALLRDPNADVRDDLQRLQAQTIGLHRFVEPQHEALHDILADPPGWLSDQDGERLREVADQTRRAVETLGALRESIRSMQDQMSLRQAERMNRISYLLTIIAGLFLPLNLVAAMLGANVGGIPGAESSNGFWWMTGVLIALTVGGLFALRWMRRL